MICPCGCGYELPDLVSIPRAEEEAEQHLTHWLETIGLDLARVRARDNRPAMVQARREAARYLRHHGWSLNAIGAFLERDHTTIASLLDSSASPRLKVLDERQG